MMLAEVQARYPGAVAFRFGDSDAMNAELIALVVAGKKRATCGPLRDFGEGGAAKPVVGRRDIITNWDGTPAVVIETVDVSYCSFAEIGENFALAEGENDDLAGWRRDHAAYFERNSGYSPDMALICERFEVVEIL
jgi:uncharacterized protein YhfF